MDAYMVIVINQIKSTKNIAKCHIYKTQLQTHIFIMTTRYAQMAYTNENNLYGKLIKAKEKAKHLKR